MIEGSTASPLRLSRVGFDAFRLLEALPVAVIAVDAAAAVRFVNAAAAELFAAGLGLTGRRLQDVFGAASPVVALSERARRTEAQLIEADLVLPSGAHAVVAAAPVGDGDLVSLAFTPLPRRRATAVPSTAARALAHEVRNPLAGIRAAAQLLSRTAEEDVRTLTGLICDEVDRIHRLTDRIDPFDSLGQSAHAAVNVHEALDRVRAIIRSEFPAIRLKERYDPSLPPIHGDLDQLIQAFLNLAKNAAEALAGVDGGEIMLATSFRPGVRVRRGAGAPARPQLEVAIIDNGPGLADHIRDRLFEPFVSGKAGGMGLGLAIVAEVVARHEGAIELDSAPGRTAFRIVFPLLERDPAR
ncbi:MAG: PAS domain-containing protein [Alphaproteobacteria bacterium]|nr:PAS domain-containing protein [Alphaproteobacteria bacterium]